MPVMEVADGGIIAVISGTVTLNAVQGQVNADMKPRTTEEKERLGKLSGIAAKLEDLTRPTAKTPSNRQARDERERGASLHTGTSHPAPQASSTPAAVEIERERLDNQNSRERLQRRCSTGDEADLRKGPHERGAAQTDRSDHWTGEREKRPRKERVREQKQDDDVSDDSDVTRSKEGEIEPDKRDEWFRADDSRLDRTASYNVQGRLELSPPTDH
ncbi:hypothetical protein EYF80_036281 [Liparis tanakae]|uniref:Uncharacterized protein n=1 Tax=Liparis tanakae TaxID=230148 RepID=A0A4Z2GIZ0_9TELE|nr:hypothetical protein EYF80_036281 [Liparis tanakae]